MQDRRLVDFSLGRPQPAVRAAIVLLRLPSKRVPTICLTHALASVAEQRRRNRDLFLCDRRRVIAAFENRCRDLQTRPQRSCAADTAHKLRRCCIRLVSQQCLEHHVGSTVVHWRSIEVPINSPLSVTRALNSGRAARAASPFSRSRLSPILAARRRPQRAGPGTEVLLFRASAPTPRCSSQSIKPVELEFRALLTDGGTQRLEVIRAK
jgi:hypothetical protein